MKSSNTTLSVTSVELWAMWRMIATTEVNKDIAGTMVYTPHTFRKLSAAREAAGITREGMKDLLIKDEPISLDLTPVDLLILRHVLGEQNATSKQELARGYDTYSLFSRLVEIMDELNISCEGMVKTTTEVHVTAL